MADYKPIGIDTAINLLSEFFRTPYIISNDKETKQLLSGYNITTESANSYDRLSQFGTPVLGTFKMIQNDLPYMKYDNAKLTDAGKFEFEFPLATIVDFSRPKLDVVTPTNGGLGSVKEIMGLDDWHINIRGLIIDDESRQYQQKVEEQQKMLNKINEISGAIAISGNIFSEKNITQIYIRNLNYTAVQGKPRLVQYEIEALSDVPFVLDYGVKK